MPKGPVRCPGSWRPLYPAELASLSLARPNPFKPATDLSFSPARSARVRLRVFDVSGRFVARLAEGEMSAGRHDVHFAPRQLPSGVYLLSLGAAGEVFFISRA